MRVAVFSDSHGNPYACQAVLQALKSGNASYDALVIAGDICLGGSDPGKCLDLLQEAGVQGVYGNTETYLNAPEYTPEDELHRSMWPKIQPAIYWVRSNLSPDQANWLQSLPFELRFSPTSSATDDLLIVHANPKNVETMIYPCVEEQARLLGKIVQPDDDPALVSSFENVQAGVIAFGHLHTAFQRRWKELTLVDVAPCSLPSIHHDQRAHYTLFTWKKHQWDIDQRWVEYDKQQEIKALRACDMPNVQNFIRYFE